MADGRRRALLLILLAILAGCVSSGKDTVQRATEGPTAEEIYRERFLKGYGRPPSTDEYLVWKDQLDQRVADFLRRHPEILTSPRVSRFRALRRVAVGMNKEEVDLLAGLPEAITSDEAQMRPAARQFWPEIQKHAKEMWTYPGGWRFYFDGDRLVDLTVIGQFPIE